MGKEQLPALARVAIPFSGGFLTPQGSNLRVLHGQVDPSPSELPEKPHFQHTMEKTWRGKPLE